MNCVDKIAKQYEIWHWSNQDPRLYSEDEIKYLKALDKFMESKDECRSK